MHIDPLKKQVHRSLLLYFTSKITMMICSITRAHGRSFMSFTTIILCFLAHFFYPSATLAIDVSNHQPHRSAFHFQLSRNWMNDPNGLMFYKGYYHLFYQYNPYAPFWSFNLSWGHAVSRDLLNWMILEELALEPDKWYDECGCWSGSATFVTQDKPVMLYTGIKCGASTADHVQVQAMAVAEDPDDLLLRKWTKISENPILTAPAGVRNDNFRDPSTAWLGSDGNWRMLVGALLPEPDNTGLVLLYRSPDFVHWSLAEKPLHSIPHTGMWECPDFFPISTSKRSPRGDDVRQQKHVLKISHFNTVHDHYVVGMYDYSTDRFTPRSDINGGSREAGIGYRLDYGKYYASKSFYDSSKDRQILIGWVNESCSQEADIAKGWASLQALPRVLWLDEEDEERLLQWPVEEVEQLHQTNVSLNWVTLESGSLLKVDGIMKGSQVDIQVDFLLPTDLSYVGSSATERIDVNDKNVQQICSNIGTSRTAGLGGVLGPFGLLVLASHDQIEQTAIFFYVVHSTSGWKALICSDQSRSSLEIALDKTTYGSFVPVSAVGEHLSLRVLVDHSIVETFVQGGKICITSRVYPTLAIHEDAHLFLFNNGTVPIHVPNFVAWDMQNVNIATGTSRAHMEDDVEARFFVDLVSSFHDSTIQT